MSQISLTFLNNVMIEKLYELKQRGKRLKDLYNCPNSEDFDILLVNPNDYEERLDKGFKMFEMAQIGYPEDE